MGEKKVSKKNKEAVADGGKFDLVELALEKDEILHFKEGDYVSVELIYKLMREYPHDVKNRLRVSLSRGKFNDAVIHGVRVVSLDAPMKASGTSVRIQFTVL